jgi:hypothetical protein
MKTIFVNREDYTPRLDRQSLTQHPAPMIPDNAAELQLKAREERKVNQGRFAWAKKHGYLGCDPQWHELWVLLIPAFGCSCKQDFADYCKDNPPDFSSPDAYWLWGVQLHNWVNRKLGKPELTVEEALAIWRREDGVETQQTTTQRDRDQLRTDQE